MNWVFIYGHLGVPALGIRGAALAVFRTLEGMLIGFFAGFSNASSILVGTCVGAEHHGIQHHQIITPQNFKDLAKEFQVTLPERFLL